MIRPALMVLAATTAAVRAHAQDPSGAAKPTAPRTDCFGGRPLPACSSFWITEASYGFRLTANGDQYSTRFPDYTASLEAGWMKNLSERFALGGTASAHLVDGFKFGIRARGRYWVTPKVSLDLAPGLLVAGTPGSPRFTMDASLMYRDRIGFTVQSFVLSSATYRQNGTYSVGNRLVMYPAVKLGSKLGIAGAIGDAVALVVAIGAFAIICSNNGCD
jgi:hypothetical protein